jgi:glycosyltransferase involved in cell wall biosynthesis
MSELEVSVVLPVRDAAVTVTEAVRSVLASRQVRLELICVDDGSRDSTASILEALAQRDPRMTVLRMPPRGIVPALNTGLEHARAPLVARMDGDDEMHPERLRAQLEHLAGSPEIALVGCQVESFREGGLADGYRIYTEWVNRLVSEEAICREMLVECPIPHPTWMLRRRVVRALGGYRDRDWPEDLDLLYRILEAGQRIGKVPRPLHRRRDPPRRLSRVDPRYGREAFARVKAHFVGRLRPMRAAVVWGAGRTGRRFVRLIADEGIATRALVDIRPDRIGTSWRGIPILSPESLDERVSAWRRERVRILGAVASRGARGEIRTRLASAGLTEGDDFLMVA